MTIGDAITGALQDLGVLAAGEAPAAEDSSVALDRVNDWLDGLATEGLTVYTNARTTWALVNGTGSYTIGTGGDVNITRPTGPEAILNIGYQDTSQSPTQEYLLGRPLTEDAYAAITQKTFQSTYPTSWYYNPTYPLGTLIAWPVPTSNTLQGVIYTPQPLSEYATLATALSLPPGYRRFIRTNLVVELGPTFNVQLSNEQQRLALEAKANAKRANVREDLLSVRDVSRLGRRSAMTRSAFLTGQF
ncbi:MAG: hypothetical protein VW405_00990 [Rhodospirillaceae bacterium]